MFSVWDLVCTVIECHRAAKLVGGAPEVIVIPPAPGTVPELRNLAYVLMRAYANPMKRLMTISALLPYADLAGYDVRRLVKSLPTAMIGPLHVRMHLENFRSDDGDYVMRYEEYKSTIENADLLRKLIFEIDGAQWVMCYYSYLNTSGPIKKRFWMDALFPLTHSIDYGNVFRYGLVLAPVDVFTGWEVVLVNNPTLGCMYATEDVDARYVFPLQFTDGVVKAVGGPFEFQRVLNAPFVVDTLARISRLMSAETALIPPAITDVHREYRFPEFFGDGEDVVDVVSVAPEFLFFRGCDDKDFTDHVWTHRTGPTAVWMAEYETTNFYAAYTNRIQICSIRDGAKPFVSFVSLLKLFVKKVIMDPRSLDPVVDSLFGVVTEEGGEEENRMFRENMLQKVLFSMGVLYEEDPHTHVYAIKRKIPGCVRCSVGDYDRYMVALMRVLYADKYAGYISSEFEQCQSVCSKDKQFGKGFAYRNGAANMLDAEICVFDDRDVLVHGHVPVEGDDEWMDHLRARGVTMQWT